jgi:hypothetical protein
MQAILQYDLVNDHGVEQTCFGHRLIASTFRPGGLPDDHYVYHLDGNTANNAFCRTKTESVRLQPQGQGWRGFDPGQNNQQHKLAVSTRRWCLRP